MSIISELAQRQRALRSTYGLLMAPSGRGLGPAKYMYCSKLVHQLHFPPQVFTIGHFDVGWIFLDNLSNANDNNFRQIKRTAATAATATTESDFLRQLN